MPDSSQVEPSLRIVVLGLSITSAWGNGHATTYRGLLRELARLGHQVTFLERDVSWYAAQRDLRHPEFCTIELYDGPRALFDRHEHLVRTADLVIVGSYVPDGVEVGGWVTRVAHGVTAFYDIDTPITLAHLAAGEEHYLSRALVPRYDLYLSFAGGRALERLEHEHGARRARALYCSVDPEHYYWEPGPRPYALGYMGTYSSDRQPPLEQLLLEPARKLTSARFAVAGPQYPETIDWPENVARTEHLAPGQHRMFYNQQRFTLNVTRARMRELGHSPSVRLFEAAACGTPIISDDWPGLSELFTPGSELLIAHSGNEVVRWLCDLQESERAAIGRRGRDRVLSKHTAAQRACELLHYVREVRA